MFRYTRHFVTAATAALVLSCSTSVPQASGPVHLVIAATTDHHGWIEGHEETLAAAPGLKFRSGGLAVLGGYLNNLRDANPGRFLVVDAGDIFQGTLPSNLFEGRPVVEAYNILGYRAAAIGNHEFDYGPVGERSTPKEPGDDPFGALKANIARAQFPFLSSNIFEKATGKRPPWAKPWAMVEVAGVKIGVIGAITIDTPTVTAPANVESLKFIDPAEAVMSVLPEVRSAGAQLVIVAAHLGGACVDVSDPNDPSRCEPMSDVFQMARALPAGSVDIIFSGHTHNQIRHFINGIAISEAPALGRGLSVVDVYVDPSGRTRNRVDIRPHVPICEKVFRGTEVCNPRNMTPDTPLELVARTYEGKKIVPDEKVAAQLRPYVTEVEAKKQQPLGFSAAATFTGNYRAESTLGNLVADAMLAAHPEADFAMMNSGGIRSELPAGEVNFGEMFEVLPFDNYIALIRVSGAELRELLRLGTLGRTGIMQVAGLKMEVDGSKDAGLPAEKVDHIVSLTTADGQAIDPHRMYTLVTNDFLAAGGDGLAPLTRTLPRERFTLTSDLIRDVVLEQLRKRAAAGPLVPKLDGRIKGTLARKS